MSTAVAAVRDRGLEPARRWSWRVLAALNSVVIVVSAARSISEGYEPIGDNALIELRSRDVLTEHHPWIGPWSSASIGSGVDVNHPGPLLYDLLALPVRLLGGGPGIALGVAAVHVVVVWAIGAVTWRIGGATAAVVAQVVTAGLVWTLGSELLHDPWQPNVLVLPFWLFLCAVWGVATGRIAMLPLAVGVGTFTMQTHLSYAFLVPAVLVVAAALGLWTRRSEPDLVVTVRRPLLVTLAVGLLLWLQPLVEQVGRPGRGNLTRLATAGFGGGDDPAVESSTTGLRIGVRILGAVLGVPPWWGRPGFVDAVPPSTWVDTADGRVLSAPGLLALAPALAGLAGLAVLIGVAVVALWRAGERRVVAGFAVAGAGCAVAAVTVVVTPIDVLGLSPHKVRWLWVLGAFLTYLLAMAVLSVLTVARRRQLLGALAALGAVAALATLPTHANPAGPVTWRYTYDTVADLRTEVAAGVADGRVPALVFFDPDGVGFAEPYTASIMAELVRAGVDLVVGDTTLVRQLGAGRAADPVDERRRDVVFVRVGAEATTVPPGAARVAHHPGAERPWDQDVALDRAVSVFVMARPDFDALLAQGATS